jgi:shikimate 5-dehydrogenase
MTDKSPKYGLIGYPIAHSGSPALFRKAYSGKWEYDLIEDASFEKAWSLFKEEYAGINITAPFKEKAAAASDIKSTEVLSIGAANIAIKTACGIKTFNSDYLAIRKIIGNLKNIQTVAVVGYGGAGKAAAQAAMDAGLNCHIFNRSQHGCPHIQELNQLKEEKADLLIYALPLLVPEITQAIQNGHFTYILEANYRDAVLPDITPTSCTYISGETWLLEQAKSGYELLTGEIPQL